MKRLLILLVLFSCSEDDEPVFRIEDTFFESRFEKFEEIATALNVTVPKNNMILRFVEDDNINTNDSKAYTEEGQLYVDIDRKFQDAHTNFEREVEMLLFQQLANGLFGTPFRDCGIMKRVVTEDDISPTSWSYTDYPTLFDPQAPC